MASVELHTMLGSDKEKRLGFKSIDPSKIVSTHNMVKARVAMTQEVMQSQQEKMLKRINGESDEVESETPIPADDDAGAEASTQTGPVNVETGDAEVGKAPNKKLNFRKEK